MSTKTIPARTVTVCDICGCETHQNKSEWTGRRLRCGELSINSIVLDGETGNPLDVQNKTYDLCDTCLVDMVETIQRKIIGSGTV